MSAPNGAPASRTVRLGETEVTVERVSGRKASRAFAILRRTSKVTRELVAEWGRFESEYAEANTVELSRAEARRRFPPQPLVNARAGDVEAGEPELVEELVLQPETVPGPDGEPVPNPRAGEPVMVDPLAHMTEQDWQASGNVYRLRKAPTRNESIAAVLPRALELAEEEVYRLLALFAMSNQEVTAAWRAGGDKFSEVLDERADRLLDDCYLDDLVELAVVAGELVDEQMRSRLDAIGEGRLGNALRLIGLDPARKAQGTADEPQTTTETAQTSPEERTSTGTDGTSTQSSGLPSPTDGPPTPRSSSPSTFSSTSPPASPTVSGAPEPRSEAA